MADAVDEDNITYTQYLEKIKANFAERRDPNKKHGRLVKFEERTDKSDLTRDDIIRQAKGKFLMQWKGVVLLKAHIDVCIYQLLLQELEPLTIIETGTFNGGSALWMADLMKMHGIKCHIYTFDIDSAYLDPKAKGRDDITFINGDSNKIEETFPPELLKSLPHPWLVTEDAHVNVTGVISYFDSFMKPGDYLIVEDTHPEINTRLGYGLFKGIEYAPVGTSWTLDPFKAFMKKQGHKYRVDSGYTDLYGYNVTLNFNSILCKISQ